MRLKAADKNNLTMPVHQLDVLDLLTDLNRNEGVTVIMVLHDLNMAARYADHVIALSEGAVRAEGAPDAVFTPDNLRQIFGLRAEVMPDPVFGAPMIIPVGRQRPFTG